jgi:hypothetical protein
MISLRKNILYIFLFGSTLLNNGSAWADKVSDSQIEMQKRLNEQVLSQGFSVADEAKLEAYIKDATERGTPPKTTPSRYWRNGYTCGDLRRYSWNDYRDCSYYYRYHGYYWRY